METLYNIAINAVEKLLPLGTFLGDKMKLFSRGRRNIFPVLEEKISRDGRYVWIHAASLGEYEQAVPVVERLKKEFPEFRILVTFFSPSGYEIKKNSTLVDLVTYLPMDTKKNARRFLDLVRPEWAIFIKYEFWPNFLWELRKRKVNTLLVSGRFREEQPFFKPHGKWMQKYLAAFQHFFVQDEKSSRLLQSIGYRNISISGDTRFDRVQRQIGMTNKLEFLEEFKNNQLCLVAGSTWPEDEELLLPFINESADIKFVIAPHTIRTQQIQQLKEMITKKVVLFSEKEGKDLSSYSILILDTIGVLTKAYSYADIAYVGGAAGSTGLHNILEPATFGVPVIIGKNYSKFPEAKQLRKLAGLFSVGTTEEATSILEKLSRDKTFRNKTGLIAEHFVQNNIGATDIVLRHIHNNS